MSDIILDNQKCMKIYDELIYILQQLPSKEIKRLYKFLCYIPYKGPDNLQLRKIKSGNLYDEIKNNKWHYKQLCSKYKIDYDSIKMNIKKLYDIFHNDPRDQYLDLCSDLVTIFYKISDDQDSYVLSQYFSNLISTYYNDEEKYSLSEEFELVIVENQIRWYQALKVINDIQDILKKYLPKDEDDDEWHDDENDSWYQWYKNDEKNDDEKNDDEKNDDEKNDEKNDNIKMYKTTYIEAYNRLMSSLHSIPSLKEIDDVFLSLHDLLLDEYDEISVRNRVDITNVLKNMIFKHMDIWDQALDDIFFIQDVLYMKGENEKENGEKENGEKENDGQQVNEVA